MTENPYAPPRAAVADPEPAFEGPCRDVELACKLLWAGFLLDVLGQIIDLLRLHDGSIPMVRFFIACGIKALLTCWVTSRLLAGRNWMRWLIAIMNALAILATVWLAYSAMHVLLPYAANPIAATFLVLETITGLAALVLLFTPASQRFFSR